MRTPPATPLVTADELATQLAGNTPPVVLDVRYPGVGSDRDGHAEFLAGHVPGAAYVDLDAVLAGPHVPGVTGRHPLPDDATFQAGMRAAGVRDEGPVVVYDDWLSIAAARCWWLLRYHGHPDVRVLDGGWSAWRAGGYPVQTGESVPQTGNLVSRPGNRCLVDADGAARIARSGLLLDARPAGRHRGEGETIDPVAGHIPGSVSLPALSLVEDGRLLPADDLQRRFAEAGVTDGQVVGIYCGSGIQAAHVALAGAACGVLDDPALYAGSWSDWITDPGHPVGLG